MNLIALTLLCVLPSPDVVEDQVDLLEVNHFYDLQGQHLFDQVVFYDWQVSESRYICVAFRLIKSADIVPHYDWGRGCYSTTWHDDSVLRKVVASAMRTTWTQDGLAGDPEVGNRELLPKNERRELTRVRKPSP